MTSNSWERVAKQIRDMELLSLGVGTMNLCYEQKDISTPRLDAYFKRVRIPTKTYEIHTWRRSE